MGLVKTALRWYLRSNLLGRILVALVTGAVVGLLVGPGIAAIRPLGTLFVRLLTMIVMPLILFTLVGGSASISPARLGRVGAKIIGFYLATSAIAVALGLIAANVFRPGTGMDLGAGAGTSRELVAPSLVDTLLNVVPTNLFGSLASGAVLPVIFFAVVFGIGLSYVRISENSRVAAAAETLLQVFEAGAEVMYKVVAGIMQYAPIGVFALIAVVFGEQGSAAFGPLASVTATFYSAALLHLLVVLGGALLFARLPVRRFFAGTRDAIVTAFVTRSSGGTLPVTMRAAEENLGISRSIFSFTLPLGATINMDGSAIYQGVCAMFIAFAIGMPLDIGQQITVVLTAVLASIGAAGVPGAGAIMLLLVLNSVGLPVVEGTPVALAYALILGVDALLDMGRTALNVAGDLVGTAVVARSENEVDLDVWNGTADAGKEERLAGNQ
jgi:Na+/H+-dicarboxylate symporter